MYAFHIISGYFMDRVVLEPHIEVWLSFGKANHPILQRVDEFPNSPRIFEDFKLITHQKSAIQREAQFVKHCLKQLSVASDLFDFDFPFGHS